MGFFGWLTLILVLGHLYVAWRLTAGFRLQGWMRLVPWGLALGSMSVIYGARLLRRQHVDAAWFDLLMWAGYLLAGVMSILLVLTLLRDLLWWAGRGGRWLWRRAGPGSAARAPGSQASPGGPGASEGAPAMRRPPDSAASDATVLARRDLLLRGSSLGVLAATGGLTVHGVWEARRLADVVPVDVPVAGLPPEFEGLRIVQLSDIHVGHTVRRRYLQRIVEAVGALPADLIVITGDLIDGRIQARREDVLPLADLAAPLGTWFVTGNHEYYNDVESWLPHLSRLGLQPLLNEHRVLRRGDARLVLAGVTDFRAGRRLPGHASDPARARAGAEGDVRLLLAHQPWSAVAAEGMGFDLMLCGHTHGGQYFPWNLAVRYAHPYVRGLSRHHDGMWVYVNRGTGYWGPPLRSGVPAEITWLRLRRA